MYDKINEKLLRKAGRTIFSLPFSKTGIDFVFQVTFEFHLRQTIMIKQRFESWKHHSRYQKVLRVCFPLVIGMSTTSIMEFTDRLFLARYSLEAISAASPAGITAFLFLSFFGGIGAYSSIFIAQYYGAGRKDNIGIVLWQSLYFCLFAAAILIFISYYAGGTIFQLAGHSPEIRELEEIYFNLLCRGGVFHVASQTLSGFFTGRGITKPVMLFHFIGMAINIPLDYALINGFNIFPEMGIQGAAIATVFSWGVTTILLIGFIFTEKHIKEFRLLKNTSFNRHLFMRLLKFGVPGTLQFSLDILAFTVFILLVGRIGKVELAATNIVIAINSIAFMPAIGVSQGVSVLVGQALGRGSSDLARHYTWSSAHLLLIYILVIDLVFIFFPETLLTFFIPAEAHTAQYESLTGMGASLLRIVSIYLLFDALYMVFSGTLKGAGDTRFLMYTIGAASLFCMIFPLYVGIEVLSFSIQEAWLCVLFFIITLFTIVTLRYKQGKWKKMLVIEQEK